MVVIVGACVSWTTTLNPCVLELFAASFAVHETGVVPSGYVALPGPCVHVIVGDEVTASDALTVYEYEAPLAPVASSATLPEGIDVKVGATVSETVTVKDC